jgi:signal transduction histidine kinase
VTAPSRTRAHARPREADGPARGLRQLLYAFTSGVRKVWLLNAALFAAVMLLAPTLAGVQPPITSFDIPWPVLVLAFAAAESAVVHLRFRENAHSFSMSDVPMLVGLFFVTPLVAVAAQLVGNFISLTLHRRLPPVKVAFNLGQFALQTSTAALVLYTVIGDGDPLGPLGWGGAITAVLVAVLVADSTINLAIRFTGGIVSLGAMREVLGLSMVAAIINATVALAAVALLATNPSYWWIAVAIPGFMYVAYRAYVQQREESSRIRGLLEATDALHRSPQIEEAMVRAAAKATSLLDAEMAMSVIFTEDNRQALVTTVAGDREICRMQPVPMPSRTPTALVQNGDPIPHQVISELGLTNRLPERVTGLVTAPLHLEDANVGFIVAINRVGDVSTFGASDVEVLGALATQLSVSLQNDRLTDSLAAMRTEKDHLEDLVEAKDQFVASVSHELRTPLTGVVGLARELHDNFDFFGPEELKDVIAMIADQGAELANIIEDLLVAARADIGTLSIAPDDVDLIEELQTLLGSHARSAGGEPIEIRGEAPTVWVDALRLRQIVRNLLTNAERYGGKRIWVEVGESTTHALVAVVDDGPGVPEGEEERIFESYHSAHENNTQPGSFGLGLAVARRIAEMGGGALEYHRRDGLTRFELRVPFTSPD